MSTMSQREADTLVAKLRSYWPHGGPSNDAWAEVFKELPPGAVGTALIRLRDQHDTCPSIKQFREMYHSLRTASTDPPRKDGCPFKRCNGDGWVFVAFTANDIPYEGVIPCTCPAGLANRPVYDLVANGDH